MQKVLRRTALAKAQAVRKATKRSDKNRKIEAKLQKGNDTLVQREVAKDIRHARQVRRERHELGPLAPRWDVGEQTDSYGTMDQRRLRGKEIPREQRTKYWNIVEGDRVVIITGREKGRIGEVKSCDKKTEQVTVAELNKVDVPVPEWLRKGDSSGEAPPTYAVELGVPLANVRLVHALVDPATGIKKDVIVQKLVNGRIAHDRFAQTQRWSRYIAGLNIKVPWPQRTPREKAEHAIDTLRIAVEARTWTPTLLRPPMPLGVIDELRNKFSKFRDRHDDEWVAEKIRQDEEKAEKAKDLKGMMSPTIEARRAYKQARVGMGKRATLTVEQQAMIGEVMARAKGLKLEDLPVVEGESNDERPEVDL